MDGGSNITELSYMIVPPGATVGANFARLGALNAIRIFGFGDAGERTSSLAIRTSA
jgi:hypothetical protein